MLSALHFACFPHGWSPEAIHALLSPGGVFALLYEMPEGPVGFTVARAAADEAEIISLGTLPRWRRQCIAGHLLAEAARIAAERGAAALYLEVEEDNLPARAFYRKHGFAETGIRKGYYPRPGGPAVNAVVMRRAVAEE